jgi:hypothetical protein
MLGPSTLTPSSIGSSSTWSGRHRCPLPCTGRVDELGGAPAPRHQLLIGVILDFEMLNPLPPVTAQTIAAMVEVHVNGPAPVESPQARVDVSTPALLPHCDPKRVFSELSTAMITDRVGELRRC